MVTCAKAFWTLPHHVISHTTQADEPNGVGSVDGATWQPCGDHVLHDVITNGDDDDEIDMIVDRCF